MREVEKVDLESRKQHDDSLRAHCRRDKRFFRHLHLDMFVPWRRAQIKQNTRCGIICRLLAFFLALDVAWPCRKAIPMISSYLGESAKARFRLWRCPRRCAAHSFNTASKRGSPRIRVQFKTLFDAKRGESLESPRRQKTFQIFLLR